MLRAQNAFTERGAADFEPIQAWCAAYPLAASANIPMEGLRASGVASAGTLAILCQRGVQIAADVLTWGLV